MSDPHIVRPGTLATPFSAAEIRDASADGMTLLIRTDAGGDSSYRRTTFVACDPEGALRSFAPTDAAGVALAEPEHVYSTWAELQGHAVFEAERAARSLETRATPLGTLECWRYEVREDDGAASFWFALAYPGMPVMFETRDATGEVTSRTEVIELVTP